MCVGLPPMEPLPPLEAPPPKEESEAEGEEGEKEESLEDPKPKALTFDHVIYPNVRCCTPPRRRSRCL